MSCLTSDSQASQRKEVVWVAKPYVTPTVVFRTVTVLVVLVIIFFVESYLGVLSSGLAGLPLWLWTTLVFLLIWIFGVLDMLVFRASNTYILRQDALEIHRGIVSLHSFVVTPAGFGDLLVDQSLAGRIFGYGDITVNSQGDRQTKLLRVCDPFAAADTMRDIMGKPIVRVEGHV